MSAKTTSAARASNGKARPESDLAPEYRFDYKKSRPNRFAGRVRRESIVVVLDEDAAAVFRDPERVNALLRATIAAFEKPRRRRAG